MSDQLWMSIYAVGAVQGLFLCGVLLLRRVENRQATRLLAAVVAAATVMILGGALADVLPASAGLFLAYLNINTELVLTPLILLFARALVEPGRSVSRRERLYLLPFVLANAGWILLWFVLGDDGSRRDFLAGSVAVPLYMVLKAAWLFGFTVATLRALNVDAAALRATGRRSVELSWLRNALKVLVGLAALVYLSDFATRFGYRPPIESDPFSSLVMVVMIYMATLMVLQRPWVMALRRRPAGEATADEAERLTAFLERSRPWQEPALGLGDLARALGSTEQRLSTVIRDGLDTSFYPLVNRYRRDGRMTAIQPGHGQWTTQMPVHMIPEHLDALRGLRGLRFDSAFEDEYTHIPVTSRVFSRALTEHGVEHTFEMYNGDHRNRLWGPQGRLYTEVLPWFSALLERK